LVFKTSVFEFKDFLMKTIEEQIFETVTKAQNVLIVFNRDWSGDAVASALALRLWLAKMNKKADIVAEKPTSISPYSFLPGFSFIKPTLENLRKFIISLDISSAEVNEIEYKIEGNVLDFIISPKNGFFKNEDISSRTSGFKYDLVISLSTPDFESLGSIYDFDTQFFFETTVINIDHQASNDNYGQINFINVNAVATAEILYNIFEKKPDSINADIATCLLTGLISETKSFKTANVTPRTLTIASQLIALEGRREEIINALYRSRQLNVLKLWGLVLTNLQSTFNNRIIWSIIKNEDFVATETKPENLSDIIDELIVSMPQAQIIVLAYETELENGLKETKALIYSIKNIDAMYLAQPLIADGTRNSAIVSLTEALPEGAQKLITDIEEKVRRLEA
jgi:nanoRNase/pAp phosphatase (c-di-AMP/oligoRNAs hydrolase)